MLEVVGDCSGSIFNVGLRGDDDFNAILVCAGHRERRSLRPIEAERAWGPDKAREAELLAEAYRAQAEAIENDDRAAWLEAADAEGRAFRITGVRFGADVG